ncbi:outer membrane protein assembly factor BamA [Hydrogenophaga sp.]|uniref:outer membrane protein assembly factor BamA n=1 Tax=Hydrogenophaga sp. TaxID=1904254 RepID=UPI001988954D|nr:outer membrane protein assembly factor BamA [Hydrogenophaga sp.]MBD3892750.1 outer membrane protein assembly factor BamA [Hydrogenophaga sp.]
MKKTKPGLRGLTLSVLAASLLGALPAWAVEPFTLRDIRVEGLQRVEPGTVFASLPFRVGDIYSDDQGSAAIRSLFGLGLFSDVRLQVQDGVLVVIVEERPIIAAISFTGGREFEADMLRNALRDIGLADGRPFDKALADRAEQELKRQYINRGMYAAQVLTTVTPAERNRVNLNFHVTEGDVARIGEIRIVGNQAFSESTLRSLFALDTSGWLSWYTRADRYTSAKLSADLERLRSHYLTRGFLDFRIDSTQVAISPEKDSISLTINITEGNRFVVSAVRLEGEYLGRQAEFESLVRIRVGQAFNTEEVAQTVAAFTDHFGVFGYAFAQVQAQPEIDRVNNRVTFVLNAQPQRRVYVRRINIEGNNRTRDQVIRREFRQLEAAWYDGERIRLSRNRVDRLGFFTQVGIETQPVPGAPDQVDLLVSVVEKPTGSLTLGAGFSQAERLSLVAGIDQDNVFGTGNSLSFNLNTSDFNRQFSLSTTNPYFTPDGVSRTWDIYHRTSSPFTAQGGDYRLVRAGGGLRFGVPFTERDTVFFGLNAEQTRIEAGTGLPLAYQEHSNIFGASSLSVPLTLGWTRDTRDSALVPNEGRLQRVNAELGVAGDTRYLRASYQFQQYIPLGTQYTLAFNTELGYGRGMGGRPFPVFKNFFGGGLGSVRGFQQGTLGPRSGIVGAPAAQPVNIGGSRSVALNAEFIAPFPGAGTDRTLRVFAFADAGNVFGDNDPRPNANDLRASVGVGLSWISPIGPLRFAYATPVRHFDGDKIQRFQFQIGTSF